MRRYPSPLALSASGMTIVLVVTTGVAWTVARQGGDVSETFSAIMATVYLDELLPRLAMAVFFVLGGYLLTRSGPQPNLPIVAAACAVTGILACLYLIIRAELAFAEAYPDGSISAGWPPGEARAELLPIPYLAALVQALLGLVASTTLLTAMAVKRSRA